VLAKEEHMAQQALSSQSIISSLPYVRHRDIVKANMMAATRQEQS
jgi:hypothetical protein